MTPQLAVEDEVGAELEDEDAVGVLDLVHLRQPLLQLRLCHKPQTLKIQWAEKRGG